MKAMISLLLVILPTLVRADGLYTDTWVNWTPAGKVFDVVCFSKKNGNKIMKDIRILQFNRRAFQYKENVSDAELKALSSKGCYFEQKDAHTVSRDEFFEEIISVKCSLNQLPFKDGDFRILGTNAVTTSVKRLRDGRVWILPTSDCTFTTQLQKKPMVPAPAAQMEVKVSGELSFPGENDQVSSNPAPAVQPIPEAKREPKLPVEKIVEKPQAEPVRSESKAVKSSKIKSEPPAPNPAKGTIKNLINNLN